MTESGYPRGASSDPKVLLQQLNDEGITDLDGLVQKVVADNRVRENIDHVFLCTQNYCVVVRPEEIVQ
jgi:hypothetical protein